MNRLVAAEWLKLRTTRLLVGMVPTAVVLSVAAVSGAVLSAENAGVELASAEGVRRALHVTGTGCVLVLVVGIVMSAGEYRTQTATDTFLTTPTRSRVIAAKLAVGALVGIAFGLVTAAICLVVALALYSGEGAAFPLDGADVWLTLLGTVVYAALFGVLGVALGSLLRNQVLAIVGALAWLLVVEQVLIGLLPDVVKWFPGAAGQAIVRTPEHDLLDPGVGAAVLLAYGALIATGGVLVAARRDA